VKKEGSKLREMEWFSGVRNKAFCRCLYLEGKRGRKEEKEERKEKRGKRKESEQRCAFGEKSDASFIDCAHHYALDYCRLSR